MAFSAQTDHGLKERKNAVLCEIKKESSKAKTKVCPPAVNFDAAIIVFKLPSCFPMQKDVREDCEYYSRTSVLLESVNCFRVVCNLIS